MSEPAPRRVVALLASQAFAFGLSESLLLIVANAIFLDAYGSKWLPLTYVGIAVVGALAAAGVARTLRRWPLHAGRDLRRGRGRPRLRRGLGGAHDRGRRVGVGAAARAVPGAAPDRLHLHRRPGRAAARRAADQARLPRIVSGFAFGFLGGWLAGRPLLALLGSPITCCSSRPPRRSASWPCSPSPARVSPTGSPTSRRVPIGLPRPPLRRLLATRFALLVIGYQVISAAGTYLIEFILFDRAAARYDDAASLTRFLSTYTALLNVVEILFLVLVAGVLAAALRPAPRDRREPRARDRARRGDARCRARVRRRCARPVRPRRGCARRRHLADGRHDAHVRHHRVPTVARRGTPGRPGDRRRHRRARRDRRDGRRCSRCARWTPRSA